MEQQERKKADDERLLAERQRMQTKAHDEPGKTPRVSEQAGKEIGIEVPDLQDFGELTTASPSPGVVEVGLAIL